MKISRLAASIPPSETLAITQKAKELTAAGIKVISFAAGEPDFITPEPIREAAIRAMNAGRTGYTAVGGAPELKKAIAAATARQLGLDWAPSEIVASCGAKHTLYNLFLSILDPGDEVIIPAPYWVSYPTMVSIAGGKPVLVSGRAEDGYVPPVAALDAAVTPATKAIVINNPTNPTGAFWDREQLATLAAWLERHPSIAVISDSIYDALVYDGLRYTELLALAPSLRSRYVLVNGVSKSFAMTGWRLGWALAPASVVRAMEGLQSQSTSNPTSITQWGAIEALERGEELIAPMRAQFEKRRDLITRLLTDIPGVKLVRPRGAFYAFPDVSAWLGRRAGDRPISDDGALAAWLIEEAKVAVVPGTPFGAPGHMRLSYACSEADIVEGVRRIAEAVATLR